MLFYAFIEAEVKAFHSLQQAFTSPSFLIHYNRTRPLFVNLNAFKSFEFATMIYHHKKNSISKAFSKIIRIDVQSIMFLSRYLNTAEHNYWPTKLEIADVMWIVKKIRHMIEFSLKSPVIVYTDHSAAVSISKQTTLNTISTNKLNLRLIRVSQYLSTFNLELRHKADKSNVIPDALSRLSQAFSTLSSDQSEKALDALYDSTECWPDSPTIVIEPVTVYHAILVKMSDDFKHRLKLDYVKDSHWEKLLVMLKPSAATQAVRPSAEDQVTNPSAEDEPTTQAAQSFTGDASVIQEAKQVPNISFRLREGLIYHVNGENIWRLCIPSSMKQEMFEQAHDLSSHGGYHRCHDRLSHTVFIRHLFKNLRAYIAHCPACQLNQIKRHKPYESLVPVTSPAIPFHIVAMDFVVALPSTKAGNDCLLIIICKATKRNLLIPEQETWSAPQ